MSSVEGMGVHETQQKEVHDIPRSHWEGLEKTQLEKMSLKDASFEVGKHYFLEDVQTSPGTLEAFRELEKEGNAEQFAKYYSDYVSMPSIMRLKNPEMYEFMRDRVFYGKEYKYETKSNAFNMTFPFSPDESRELRKMATANQNFAAKVMGNKMNFLPEESKGPHSKLT